MRTLIVFSLVTGLSAHAQNWALLNPTYKYNYSNDGTDTISNQIFVTHIDTLGVDSFRYELNRIGVVCDTCVFNSFSCWSEYLTAIQPEQPQFLGSAAVENEGTWWLTTPDTLRIEPTAHLGATWTSSDGIVALVISEEAEEIFGEVDSVKRLAFSSGEILTISKAYGVRGMSTGQFEYGLVGVEGLEVGAQFPTITDFFNYSPGDILQYVKEGSNVAGNELHYTTVITKYRVLDRSDTNGRTDYNIRLVRHSETMAYDVTQGFSFVGSSTTHATDTFAMSVVHDHWTQGNSFGDAWFNTLWPGAVCRSENESQGYPRTLMDVQRGTDDAHTIRAVTSSEEADHTMLCIDQDDSTRAVILMDPEFQREYHEGIGLMYEHFFYFEFGYTESLVGYMLDGVQTGTIYSDGSWVGTESFSAGPALQLFPVPASDVLHVTPAAKDRSWIICDLFGRPIQHGRMSIGDDSIDTSTLPVGAYVLRIDDRNRKATVRFVIAR